MTQTVFPNLMTEDIESTIAWYQRNLGAEVKMTVPSKVTPNRARFATIIVAGNDIMFQTLEDIADKYPGWEDKITVGGSIALNVQVPDAQAVYDGLAADAAVVKEPADMFYGMREFTVADPNGAILTVASMIQKDA